MIDQMFAQHCVRIVISDHLTSTGYAQQRCLTNRSVRLQSEQHHDSLLEQPMPVSSRLLAEAVEEADSDNDRVHAAQHSTRMPLG